MMAELLEKLSLLSEELKPEVLDFVKRWAPAGMEERMAEEMGSLFGKVIGKIFTL